MPSKLLVRGSINIDEFFEVEHIVRSGETISSSGFSRRAGGKGANQSVACARAGAQVDFAGWVGKDGTWLYETLQGYGVGTGLMGTDEELPTGRAVIQLSLSTADNSIVLLPGSNFSPSSPYMPFSSQYTHLLLQNEIPLSETLSALHMAHEKGVKTVFNPSPILRRSELESWPWGEVNWLIVNEREGEDLLAILSPASDASEAAPKDAEDLLARLRTTALGSLEGIIITRGAKGVSASIREVGSVSVEAGKVEGGVVDTTGAGDCFTGFFATLLSSLTPSSSTTSSSSSPSTLTPDFLRSLLHIANQAAAMCCEKNGAMESIPTLAEVKERMRAGWPSGAWDGLLRA
ncbi:hypothetical protein JCM8547_004154 [Rhodosporidiobolus lusitaniae]